MIKPLANQTEPIASAIHAISMAAYQIEANIIGVDWFPPLREAVEDIQTSENQFYGYMVEENLVGVIEIEREDGVWLIARLCVSPSFFRRGIGSALVAFAVGNYTPCRVSTAVNNHPAIQLYEKHGFIQSTEQVQVTSDIAIASLTIY